MSLIISPDFVPLFTSTTDGTVAASGGGTTNFLRADGTWQPTTAGSYLSAATNSTQDGYFTGVNLIHTASGFYSRIIHGTGVLTANRTVSVPFATDITLVATSGAQTLAGQTTFSNPVVTVGTSTAASTYGLGTGATGAATTKAINIGTGGVSTSTTNIEIGGSTTFNATNLYGAVRIRSALDVAGTGIGGNLFIYGVDWSTAPASFTQGTLLGVPWTIINAGTNTSSLISIQTSNSTNTWTFSSSGQLSLPLDTAIIRTSNSASSILQIKTAQDAYTWSFGNTGTLSLPALLELTAITDPSAPAAGKGYLYAKDIAGRIVPKWIGPSGIDYPLQAHIGFNNVRAWRGGATIVATTFAGTTGTLPYTGASPTAPTIPNLAATNLLTQTVRSTISTGATAGGLAYIRGNQLSFWRGNAAGLGGFMVIHRFAISGTLQAGMRACIGVIDVAANPTNIDPLTTTTPGGIGLAVNTNTGNWSLVNNITGTARTATGLGASFPLNNTSLMELVLWSVPNGASIGYRVTNLSTGATTSGSLSTNIPASTTFLTPVAWVTNNATAAAQTLDFISTYVETDY